MNPLSPFAYHRRHKRGVLLLAALVCLATLGVGVMVGVLDSFIEYSGGLDRYLTRFSMVSAMGVSLDPSIVSRIRAHPDVARAIPEKSLDIVVPIIQRGFDLFGVPEADLQVLMDVCDLHLKEGRLLRARTNEIVLSEELADALGLRVGDRIGRSADEEAFGSIPTDFVLVGIVESDPSASPIDTLGGRLRTGSSADRGWAIRLGLVSHEYLESHELYASRSSGLIVIPREGRKDTLDRFLETEIAPLGIHVLTHRLSSGYVAQGLLFFHLIFGVVDLVVSVVIALAVAMIHQIALSQRTAEFGLLHAVGYHKNRLVRRLTLETAGVVGAGWIAGLALSWLLFAWLKSYVYAPRGMELSLANLTPIWFSALIPLMAVAFVSFSIMRTLARLDAVSIIERGRLAAETGDGQRRVRRSMTRPLSSWMFYLRHRRRGLLLALTTALLIPGVAFPVFVLSPMSDMNKLFFEHLRYASIVSPRAGDAVDPGLTAQLRTHPAVARVVPAVGLGLLVKVPPANETYANLHAVPAEDMQSLVDLYELHVEDGRLPSPRSNEIVLSRPMALNRGLSVGDKVGLPVYSRDFGLPTEMVIVGILASSSLHPGENELWNGFASYEYVRSHEAYSSQPVSLLVVPAEGQKAELDAWLEQNAASSQTAVLTYEASLRRHQQGTWRMFLQFAVVESVIAVVAAIALSVLSYIYFSQRREEFGTLHAIGHSLRWLVRRTVGETVTVVAVAWLIGAAVCLAGLVYMQADMYAPKGLTLNLFNPVPWLFTMPMPLAVVGISAGLVAWMLSRLDPVSIIERR